MWGGSEGDEGGAIGDREGAGGSDALRPSSPRLSNFRVEASLADSDDVSGGIEDNDDVSVTAPSVCPSRGSCQIVFHVSSALSVAELSCVLLVLALLMLLFGDKGAAVTRAGRWSVEVAPAASLLASSRFLSSFVIVRLAFACTSEDLDLHNSSTTRSAALQSI